VHSFARSNYSADLSPAAWEHTSASLVEWRGYPPFNSSEGIFNPSRVGTAGKKVTKVTTTRPEPNLPASRKASTSCGSVHAKDIREVTLEDLISEAGEIHHGALQLHTLFTLYTQCGVQ